MYQQQGCGCLSLRLRCPGLVGKCLSLGKLASVPGLNTSCTFLDMQVSCYHNISFGSFNSWDSASFMRCSYLYTLGEMPRFGLALGLRHLGLVGHCLGLSWKASCNH